ncbi:MAG TPA: PEGA domain-containing protein, partial [Verrucomicrobiae bacterium]
ARVFATAGLRASSALPVVSVPGSGLMLHGTPTNPAHFLLDMGTGRAPQPQSVDTSVFPTLSVQLPGANNGAVDFSSLSITTNASDCEVSVDGTPLKHGADGQVLSPPLNPGKHKVRLSCSGFQDMEKTAMVKDGQVVPRKLDFAMTSLAAAAPAAAAQTANRTQLSIFNAPPDAAIFQNQVRIGTVGADGRFVRDLEPGSFTWEWRKPGFEPRKETRTVRAGDVLRLAGAMLPSTGSVVLKVVPDGALITVVRESDDSLINVANNVPVTLAAGSYRVSAQAPDYLQKTDSITIANGKPITLAWSLEKSAAASQPSRLFENGDTWIPAPDAAGWWIHPGAAYSSLRASTGTFTINFLHKKHSHKINILADCRSHDDCIVYNIDGHNLTTKVIADGSTVSDEKEPHGMDSDPSFHFVFEISADAITVKNQTGTILSSVTRRTPGKISIQNGNPLKIN